MSHGQYVGSCGQHSPLSRVSGTRTFEVVPSICVAERYDTNVFYIPPTPSIQRDDFVTTLNGGLRINCNGDLGAGALSVGGFNENYIRNPSLNYIGMNGTMFLNLNNSIRKFFPNASLSVFDSVRYTPLPPGFVNPTAGTSPNDPANQNIYAQGFLASRTNNLVNNGNVSVSYATTASTSLNASYAHAMIRFGSSPSTQGQQLFDSASQTGTVGGKARLSELDTLDINYAHLQAKTMPNSPSASFPASRFFKVDSATIRWSRTLTPNLNVTLGGGGILISPGQTTTYAADAALVMKSLDNSATISYSHTAFPSFFGGGGILIGDVFSLSAVQRISQQWQLAESASYTHASAESNLNTSTFDSFFVGGNIQYWMTSVWSSSLGYNFSRFRSESGSVATEVDRQVVVLSVSAIWE